MGKYRVYSEYKDSGVEWLGEVPSHWGVQPLRAMLQQRNEKNNPIKTEQILSLSIASGVTLYSDKNRGGNKRKDDLTSYKIAREGDIVLNSMNVVVGAVGLSQYTGAISPAYYALYPRSSKANINFYAKVFSNPGFQKYLLIYGKGILIKQSDSGKLNTIRMKISTDDLKCVAMPFPSLAEQSQIATFLDRETSKIDRLIAKQEALIELLKEKRQAVISHAVTKGLDPDARMKDSGVEWLGEIPAHWKVLKFSHFASIRNGQVDPTEDSFRDLPLIAPNHIESGTGKIIKLESAGDQGADSGKYLCRKGEVIYSKIRPALAKACICPEEVALCSADMYPIKCGGNMHNEYLWRVLLSREFTALATAESERVAMPKINRDSLQDIRLPVPSRNEQSAICEHVSKVTGQMGQLEQKAHAAIDLLKERRTALISEAVTGKIDVREEIVDRST